MRNIFKIIVVFSLIILAAYITSMGRNKNQSHIEKINFTVEELSKFDGKDGRAAYVAINGVVYDLTKCRYWIKGNHKPSQGKASAGQDLTDVFKDSQHKEAYLKRYPAVGWLVESK